MADTRGELVESNCPFCDVNQFKERLIAEVDGFYIIATLGQITDGGYVLLFPVEHTLCMGTFSKEQILIMPHLARKICYALSAEYRAEQPSGIFLPLTFFEHGIVGQTVKHAHLHFLPTALDLTPKIQSDFPGSEIKQLAYATYLPDLYRNKPQPYLYWVTGEGNNVVGRVCWNPPAPSQYLRIITAEALGRPERANWRTMDPELDKRLYSETVRRLRPYFS